MEQSIIFLDIDGVLNILSDSYRSLTRTDSHVLERHLVKRLEHIVLTTNSSIVISSSWGGHMELVRERISEYSTIVDQAIIDISGSGRYRGDQILDYIKHHGVKTYVVLEDEPIDVCGDYCNVIPKENVVVVDMNNGLSHQDCMKAIKILNEGNGNEKRCREVHSFSNRFFRLVGF